MQKLTEVLRNAFSFEGYDIYIASSYTSAAVILLLLSYLSHSSLKRAKSALLNLEQEKNEA